MTFYSALHYAAKAEKYASEASMHNLGNKITNCITEIPQDIKLELNNGTLTLKAGSKVYVPNGKNADGSLKFDEVVNESDKTYATFGVNTKTVVYVTGILEIAALWTNNVYSGPTAPSGQQYMLWYDTANNLVKLTANSGSTWTSGFALPIGIATSTTANFTSIDQVFNGFGYIGSTVFALPGVKGLIPNGRNADGTLKNTEFTVDKVLIYERNLSQTDVPLWYTGSSLWFSRGAHYDEKTNLVIGGSTTCCQVAIADLSSGVISNFQAKLPFRAVDQNDFNKLDEEVAKLDGDNVFSGKNKFQNNIGLNANFYKILPNYNIADTVTSTTWFGGIYFQEKTDTTAAALMQIGKLSGGENYLNINIKKPDGSWTDGLDIHAKNSGSYVSIPTPLSTARGREAVNASWVRNNAVTYTNYSNSVAITLPTSTSNQYTCPSNGLLWGILAFGDTVGYIYINGKQFPAGRGLNSWNNSHMITLYLNKGDVIYFEHTWAAPNSQLYFLPTA